MKIILTENINHVKYETHMPKVGTMKGMKISSPSPLNGDFQVKGGDIKKVMDKPMGNFSFRIMSFMFKIRDFLIPRINILKEADIKPGFHILDYGCGPGSYSIIASEMVSSTGKIYALDIHPLAIQTVKNKAEKRGLKNIKTICSDCATGLPDGSIDVVLLYDTFHHFSNPNVILKELHSVLKPEGILSFSDHHLKESEIVSGVTKGGFFKLSGKGKKTFSFIKI